MALLLTAATSALGRSIAAELRSHGSAEPRLTSRQDCALGHDAATDELVSGVSTVVHLEPALVSSDESTDEWLDSCTRCTFNLLVAAEAAGVRHFVLLSRMDVLVKLDQDVGLAQPSWRPRPSVSPDSLGPHLAEFTARQFAFSAGQAGQTYEPVEPMAGGGPKMKITIVRLGDTAQLPTSRFWTTEEAVCDAAAEAALAVVPADGSSSPYSVTHCGEVNYRWAPSSVEPQSFAETRPGGEGWSASSWSPAPKVVVLGANGMMGPPTAWALAHAGSELLLTDLDPDSPLRDQGQIDRDKEFGSETAHQKETFALPAQAVVSTQRVDASDAAQVELAVAQADVVVMCAVVREHRELAFRVNTQGTFNAIRAAVANGHDRFINSGPVDAVVGRGMTQGYMGAATGISEPSGATPPWPGVGLYSITKGLGAEICRVFTENHPNMSHLMCIFGGVNNALAPEPGATPTGVGDMTTTMRDCGNLLRCCVQANLTRLPSNHEVFFGKAPSPSDVHRSGKAQELLGYVPYDTLDEFSSRPKL